MRAERVRAQRDATRSPFREPAAPVAESGADAESRRLGQPVWEERLGLVRASLFLLEGRFADCAAAVAAVRGFLGLVMRSQLAVVAHVAHRARGLVQHRGSGTAVGHVRLGRDDLGARVTVPHPVFHRTTRLYSVHDR